MWIPAPFGRWPARSRRSGIRETGGDMGMFLDAGVHPPNFPSRGGYLIGYLVAKELGKAYSLAQIGKLTGAQAEDSIRIKVDALCMTTE
jgi:hypothetical protein